MCYVTAKVSHHLVNTQPAKGMGNRGIGPGRIFAGVPKRLLKSMWIKYLLFDENEAFF